MTALAISLDDEHRARLDALAAATEEDPAALASRAVAEFVDYEAEFRAAVEEGLAAVRAGQVRDFDEAADELRLYMAQRLKQG